MCTLLSYFIELEASAVQNHYLQLKELSIEEVVWVDNVKSLQDATHQIEECKVVGLDCEWKPNYEKGSLPNKVTVSHFYFLYLGQQNLIKNQHCHNS